MHNESVKKFDLDNFKGFISDPRNLRIFAAVVVFALISIMTKSWEGMLIAAVIAVLISISDKRNTKIPSEAELIESGALTLKSVDQRKEILRNFVIGRVANGYRVELQDDLSAVLLYGKRPNHILHLLLSIITLGIWLFIWIIIALSVKESRSLYKIDEYGVIAQS